MNAYEHLVAAWQQDFATAPSPAFRRIATGDLDRRHYAAVLRQIFHHARENPQLQALATVRFRGDQRRMISLFYRHATSEVGHDELALRDLETLGVDLQDIRTERPLPATFALLASAFYMVEHHDPVGYLGYLFHLEYTPVQVGTRYMDALAGAGIPRAAMGFLEEHAKIDVAHCRLLERYCAELVRTPEQLDTVLFMRRTCSELYARMLEQAMATVDGVAELHAGSQS
ncbi:MAG: iron-containing redox enzyme family protein [Planctomycetota bacterium]